MPIQENDYVIVFYDKDDNRVGMRCRGVENKDEFAIKVVDKNNTECVVCVTSINTADQKGIISTDIEDRKVAVKPCVPTSDPDPPDPPGTRASFISMAWIDESFDSYSGYYGYGDYYLAGINKFKNLVDKAEKYASSCQAPCPNGEPDHTTIGTEPAGIEYCIYHDGEYPDHYGLDIRMENINRASTGGPDPDSLKDMFDTLLSDFRSKDPTDITEPEYVVLIVDNSGSMDISTIDDNGAYSSLIDHISNIIPSASIIERSFEDESWLHKWTNILNGII